MEKTLYYLPFACPAHRQLYWLVYCQPTVSRAAWMHSGFTSAAPPSRSLSLPLAPSRSGHDIGFLRAGFLRRRLRRRVPRLGDGRACLRLGLGLGLGLGVGFGLGIWGRAWDTGWG
jgi:hypothetical protein